MVLAATTAWWSSVYPSPASQDKDDRPGNGEEGTDQHGRPGELAAGPLRTRHVFIRALAAEQGLDEPLAPQPPRPPVQDVELHQPWNRGQQHHRQRAVPDSGERGSRNDGLGAAIHQVGHYWV